MAINLNAPYSSTNNGQPTINPQQLAESYGWAYSFLTSVPELNALFKEAVAQSWDSTRFTAALQATSWFQNTSAAARAAQVEKVTDPYTFAQNVASETATVQQTAASMGAALSEEMAKTIATQQLTYGWNADQVNQALARFVVMNKSGGFGGTSGQNQMALNQLAMNNGISIDNATMQNLLQNVQANKTSVENIQGFIRNQAAGKYPAYAEALLAGTNLADLASPYQQTMQNVLEVGPGDTLLTSPQITAALQNKNAKGVPTQLPLSQFEIQLKSDPRWKQTLNAQTSALQVGQQVLSDMGLQMPSAGSS